jgi:hypothetical protein
MPARLPTGLVALSLVATVAASLWLSRSRVPRPRPIEVSAGTLRGQDSYLALVRHWAPRLYQDTDDSFYVGDYITRFNFDGDYNGSNNWENLARHTTVPAYVYFAVSETQSHVFLHYAFFHPRDWHEWLTLEMHENDLEGVVLAVRKDGSPHGELVAMETLAHDEFLKYGYAPGILRGAANLDGKVTLHGSHPRLFLEAKGHGVYACDHRCTVAPGGDGIVYVDSDRAESPRDGKGNWTHEVGYQLIAMDADGKKDGNQGFWHRRNDICDTCTFGAWGKLRGDNHVRDAAKLPWAWDDPGDGRVFAGAMIFDPAGFFDFHLDGTPFERGFSRVYLNHPFQAPLSR